MFGQLEGHRHRNLELGLRYQHGTPLYTTGNNVTNFDPSRFNFARAVTVTAAGLVVPNCGDPYNGLIRAGSGVPGDQLGRVPGASSPAAMSVPAGAPRGFYPLRNLFAPRFGFAWSPLGDKTSIRGGFGMFYDRPDGNVFFPTLNSPPYLQTVQLENGNLAAPSQGRPAAQSPFAAVNALDANLNTPLSMNFSFSVQRELPAGMMVEAAYVGNLGRHLLRAPDINQATFAALVANAALPAAQRASVNALRPYLGYSAINMRLSDATSNYHSLQTHVTKRAGNLQLTGSYTWSKVLTDASGEGDNPENYQDRHFSYGPATFDRRHIFVTTYTYHLPVGRNFKGAARAVLAGWDLSGINRFQTGPLSTVTGTTSIGSRRADYAGGSVSLSSNERSVSHYFNTAAFAPTPDVRRGTQRRGHRRIPIAVPLGPLRSKGIRGHGTDQGPLPGGHVQSSEPHEFPRGYHELQFPRLWIHLRGRSGAQHSVRRKGTVLMRALFSLCALLALLLSGGAVAQHYADPVVRTGYQLTARPWKPLEISREKYLDVVEGECRFSIRFQNAEGAIIDPFIKREHQYATPYFAYAVGALIAEGRALDLLPYGVKAMEHSTANFGAG
jgi:hypothetical protein